MSAKLKTVLLILGLLATGLIISQLVMGLLIVRGGSMGSDMTKLIKAHQHSGYATVTVVLAYILSSITAVIRLPGKAKV